QLELACRVQLDVLASNQKHRLPDDAIAEKAAHQLESYPIPPSVLEWPALLRKLDRVDRSYRE
ncbi:MAG: class II aldolase/adducin family protein, partial [Ktedonobacterales bacterium]